MDPALPSSLVEVIPWSLRPDWIRALLDRDDDAYPWLGKGWYTVAFGKPVDTWVLGESRDASEVGAADPRVLLLAPSGEAGAILDVDDELFGYGTPIYWIEAATPNGPRLIALLTDS